MKNPDDISKLLGGYATGSLTDGEQRLLFEAALNDQQLFDALLEEQALKEAIESPGARERLLAAVRTVKEPGQWWPNWTWIGVGAAALAAITVAVMVRIEEPPQSKQVAVIERKAVPTSVPSAPSAPPAAADPGARLRNLEGKQSSGGPAPLKDSRALKQEPVETTKQLRREQPAADAVTEPPPSPKPETRAAPPQAQMDAPQPAAPPTPPQAQAPPLQAPAVATRTPPVAPQGESPLAENKLKEQSPAKTGPPPAASAAGTLERPKTEAENAPVIPPQPRPRALNKSFGLSMKSGLVTRPELAVTLLIGGQPMTSETIFHPGDTVRVLVTPAFDGHLYVLRRDRAGDKWVVKFSGDARAFVPRIASLELPSEGEPELAVVLSRHPLTDTAAIDEARRDSSSGSDDLVRKFRLTVPGRQ